MRAKLLVIVLIIIAISISFIGCSQEPLSIESITICQEVDSDSAPISPTDEFASGTSIIYISVEINNMTPNSKFKVREKVKI